MGHLPQHILLHFPIILLQFPINLLDFPKKLIHLPKNLLHIPKKLLHFPQKFLTSLHYFVALCQELKTIYKIFSIFSSSLSLSWNLISYRDWCQTKRFTTFRYLKPPQQGTWTIVKISRKPTPLSCSFVVVECILKPVPSKQSSSFHHHLPWCNI